MGIFELNLDVSLGLSEKERLEFEKKGYLICRQVIEFGMIEALRADIQNLIRILSTAHGMSIVNIANIHQAITEIWDLDRDLAISIFRALERISSLLRLVASEKVHHICRSYFNGGSYFISQQSMRFDLAGDSENLVPWHQDYPFILDSLRGLVFWGPLFDLKSDSGGIRLVEGSHSASIREHKKEDSGWLSIKVDTDELEANSIVPTLDAGDVVIMSPFLIHRSELNISSDVRWTFQFRAGACDDPKSIELGWPSKKYGHRFESLFPEHIVQ